VDASGAAFRNQLLSFIVLLRLTKHETVHWNRQAAFQAVQRIDRRGIGAAARSIRAFCRSENNNRDKLVRLAREQTLATFGKEPAEA
jgi:hypothetical protein